MEFVGAAREADERFAMNTSDADAAEAGHGSPLLQFLEQVSLLGDADGETSAERVSVMTLHAAKGLEFEGVVIAAMEEGVFPHSRALGYAAAPEEMHEERRLAYVGFTRARKRLILSLAQSRTLFGQIKFNGPSRFLLDIPAELLDQRGQRALSNPASGSGDESSGGYSVDRSYNQTWSSGSGGSGGSFSRSGGGYTRRRPYSSGGDRSTAAWNESRRKAATATTTVTRVESLDWPTGMVVAHPTFGLGKIVSADGNGADAKLTVRFGSMGEKRIVARFIKRAE